MVQMSTNEDILKDLVECLRDQISELTLRLDESAELCSAYKGAFLRNCSVEQVRLIMSDLSVSGCLVSNTSWDNMDQSTRQLFLDDIISIVED